MTGYKRVNGYQIITVVGIVAVLVIFLIILTKRNNGILVLDESQNEEIIEGQGVLGVSRNANYFVFDDEILGSLPLRGSVDEGSQTYIDNQNGFEFKVEDDFSQESGTVARLPFYWQERYEGSSFNDDVKIFVVNNNYQTFVSGITYGLGETFITDNEVVVTPRTTGYGDKFVHQAYVDLEEGKTLLLELRTNTQIYPEQLKSYIETIKEV